jgi:hypothetical protein
MGGGVVPANASTGGGLHVKRHPFDPISFGLGLFVTTLGLVFVVSDRTAAQIGFRWIWPFPVLLSGLVALLAASRMGRREADAAPDLDREEH